MLQGVYLYHFNMSLLWCSQALNPRPSALETDALPPSCQMTEHCSAGCCYFLIWRNHIFSFLYSICWSVIWRENGQSESIPRGSNFWYHSAWESRDQRYILCFCWIAYSVIVHQFFNNTSVLKVCQLFTSLPFLWQYVIFLTACHRFNSATLTY